MGLAEGSRGGWARCWGRWAIGVGETHFGNTFPHFFPRIVDTGHSDLGRHPSAAARSPSPTRRPRLPAGSHRSRSPRRRSTRPLHLRSRAWASRLPAADPTAVLKQPFLPCRHLQLNLKLNPKASNGRRLATAEDEGEGPAQVPDPHRLRLGRRPILPGGLGVEGCPDR